MAYLEIRDLYKTFSAKNGSVEALKGVSLSIGKGEIFGVIGLSGAGKSTLVRCMNLLERPDSGDVLLNGESLLALSKEQLRLRRQKIGMIFQHFNLLEQQTVLENVCFPLEIRGIPKKERREKALELLSVFGLDKYADTLAANLPYGKQRELEITRALATEPKLLLLDEPAAGMNPNETQDLMNTIRFVRDKFDMTILLIEHDMKLVSGICEKLTVLNFGQVLAEGETSEVLNNPEVIKAYLGE